MRTNLRIGIVSAAMSLDAREAATRSRQAGFAGLLFDAYTPQLSLPAAGALVARPLVPVVQRAVTLIRRRHRSLSPLAALVWERIRDTAATLAPAPDTRRKITPR